MRTHLILPLAFLLAATPVCFSQFTSGEWTYTLNDSNEATIIGYSGAGGAVEIPSTLDGKPVKQVGKWSPIFGYSNTTVTSVNIGNGVTSIGDIAFANCTGLTSVNIPDSVTSIGDYAFQNCAGLTSLTIPNSVTSIGDYAFSYCTGLTSVNIGNGVTSIGDGAFQGCTGLTSVNIPNSVTSIGGSAFRDCTGLTSVNIPNSVLSIGTDCFAETPLQSVDLPPQLLANVGSIGLSGSLATSLLVEGIAAQIVAALPDNHGIATKADLDTVVSNTVAQIQSDPASYNLSTLAQNEARYNEGITAGTSLVTANPASYSLYTSDSIMDLRMNGLMVQKQGGNAVVTFQPQTTADLTQPFTNNGTPITNQVPMPGNKGFLRIQAK